MRSVRLKLIVAGLVLTAAVAYLAYAGMQSGWVYYMAVDNFVADTSAHGQRVRLHGKVHEDGFATSGATLTAEFVLAGVAQKLPVTYRGSIPDLFEPGKEVVVEGRLGNDGRFAADVLMTKCASKYEAGSPHGGAQASAEQSS